jgi:hypothetical protein
MLEVGYGSVRGVVLTRLPHNDVVSTRSQALMLREGPHSIHPAWQDSWVRCSPCGDQQAQALQALPWRPSTSHSPSSWLCDFPTAAACNLLLWGMAFPRNAILTRSNTKGMHICSCAAYGQSAGSGCTAKSLFKRGTSPLRLEGHSIQSESTLRHFRSLRYQQYKVWG